MVAERKSQHITATALKQHRAEVFALQFPADWEVTHLAFASNANITGHIAKTWKKKERGIIIFLLLPYL